MVYFRREKVNMKKRWIKIGIYFTFLVAVVGSFFVKKNRERIKMYLQLLYMQIMNMILMI